MPRILTWSTPTASNRSRMSLAYLRRAVSLKGPEIARLITVSKIWARPTTGRSASRGRVVMRETAASTSESASVMFVPGSKLRFTDAKPSRAVENTSLTPSRNRTSGSTTSMIFASTSSADAPDHGIEIQMTGTLACGRNCRFSCASENNPNATNITINKFAALA